MNKTLTINWNLVEQNYANYCMDLFDEKPVKLSDYGINLEVKIPGIGINFVKTMDCLTNIWISILRFIFVKEAPNSVVKLNNIVKNNFREQLNPVFGNYKKLKTTLFQVFVNVNHFILHKFDDIRLGYT
jgi:hypothetical protein